MLVTPRARIGFRESFFKNQIDLSGNKKGDFSVLLPFSSVVRISESFGKFGNVRVYVRRHNSSVVEFTQQASGGGAGGGAQKVLPKEYGKVVNAQVYDSVEIEGELQFDYKLFGAYSSLAPTSELEWEFGNIEFFASFITFRL